MPGIGVITNPRSRRNRKNPQIATRLAYILGEKGDLQQPADLDALAKTALEFRKRDIDILCINGGDGTIHSALTAMARAYGDKPLPKVALLRAGTMNTIAHGLKIGGRPGDVLEYVVSRYHTERPMATSRRWLLRIDDNQYGFLFGVGIIATYLEAYYEGSEPSPMKAAWILVRAAASALVGGSFIRRLLSPFRGRSVVNQREWTAEEFVAIGVGTVDDIGLGFRPFFRSISHPGQMHVVGFIESPIGVVRSLHRMFFAKPYTDPRVLDDVATELVLRAAEPIGYMIDGDFHRGGQTVTLSIGPHVDFIRPQ